MEYALRFNFQASNKEAEYETLIAGLNLALSMDAQKIVIYSDSQLVVKQVGDEYAARDDKMALYMMKVRSLLRNFVVAEQIQVPREANAQADTLAKLATTAHQDLLGRVPIEVLS